MDLTFDLNEIGSSSSLLIQDKFLVSKKAIKIIFQINHGASQPIEDVIRSIEKNKVCLKGVIGIPEVNQGDMIFRNLEGRTTLGWEVIRPNTTTQYPTFLQ